MKHEWHVIERGWNYSIEKSDSPIWDSRTHSYYRIVVNGRVVAYARYFSDAIDKLAKVGRK